MDIDLLRARRESEKREKRNNQEKRWQPVEVAVGDFGDWLENVLSHRFGKRHCLWINCTRAQRPAVLFSLKTALGLPYDDFRKFKPRIPGPIFWGSKEALTWLAKGLRQAEIPCQVRHIRFLPLSVVQSLEPFAYPEVHELSIADAYYDSIHIREYTNGIPHFSERYRKRAENQAWGRRARRELSFERDNNSMFAEMGVGDKAE